MDKLIELDERAFLFLNGLGTESWDGFWMFMTDKWSSIPLYAILLFLTFRFYGLKKTLIVLVAVALMITVTDQLANFFKFGVARLRPCHNEEIFQAMRLVKSYCGCKYGYFSAHAGNSFAVSTFFTFVLSSRLKFIGYFLIIWALIVAYSRIYIGVHFPLDVVTGTAIGILFGWLFSRLYIFAAHKFLA